MSSGSVSENFRVPTQIGYVGRSYTKTWSGGDSPRRPPRVKPRPYRLIERRLPSGRIWRYRLPIWEFNEKHRRSYGEEHAYSLEILHLDDNSVFIPYSGKTCGSISAFTGSVSPPVNNWASAVPFDSNDQIRLVNKLRSKLQGSDFNMSVFLGEGHQTLRMIGSTAISLAASIRHLKRGNLQAAAAALGVHNPKRHTSRVRVTADNITSRWLELQYGWVPLLKDVEAGAQQLAHQLNVPFKQRVRAGIFRAYEVDGKSNFTAYALTLPLRLVRRRQLIAVISEPLSVPQLLGLQDPELVAWELLPYSFVADWFLPIGDWLSARALSQKLTGTFITSEKLVSKLGPTSFERGVIPAQTTAFWKKVSFTRSISSTLAVPMPKYKGLEKAASLLHCLNGISLLNQAVSGKIRIR